MGLFIQSFLGCSGATTQTRCIIIIYTQTSLLDEFIELYSEHRWESFSSEERTEYETDHDCLGQDQCTDQMQDVLEKYTRFLTLIGIFVICVQILQITLAAKLTAKLSKKANVSKADMNITILSLILFI